jgi:hypothetical protein
MDLFPLQECEDCVHYVSLAFYGQICYTPFVEIDAGKCLSFVDIRKESLKND